MIHQIYQEPLILGSYTDIARYVSYALLGCAGFSEYLALLAGNARAAQVGGVFFLIAFALWFLARLKRSFCDASCLRCKKHIFNFSKRETDIENTTHLKQELAVEFKEKRLETLEKFVSN